MKNPHLTVSLVLAIILGIFIGSTFKGCNSTDPCTVTTDTMTVTKTRIDTVLLERKPTITKGGKIKIDTTKPLSTQPCDTTYFTQEYKDTLIEGTLSAVVKGELLSTELNYTPKFPKYIFRTDSVFTTITNTVTKTEYKQPFGLVLGGGFGASPLGDFTVMPHVGIQLKQHLNFIYGYNITNQSHVIMVQKVFPLSK